MSFRAALGRDSITVGVMPRIVCYMPLRPVCMLNALACRTLDSMRVVVPGLCVGWKSTKSSVLLLVYLAYHILFLLETAEILVWQAYRR